MEVYSYQEYRLEGGGGGGDILWEAPYTCLPAYLLGRYLPATNREAQIGCLIYNTSFLGGGGTYEGRKQEEEGGGGACWEGGEDIGMGGLLEVVWRKEEGGTWSAHSACDLDYVGGREEESGIWRYGRRNNPAGGAGRRTLGRAQGQHWEGDGTGGGGR